MKNSAYMDLHIHSSFSKGASQRITLESIESTARIKGISLIGTGDCLHPEWGKHLEMLKEDSDTGMYYFKKNDILLIPTVG